MDTGEKQSDGQVSAGGPGLDNAINIDEGRIRGHLDKIVLQTVEQALNGFLDADAEADRSCWASRLARSS